MFVGMWLILMVYEVWVCTEEYMGHGEAVMPLVACDLEI
jgi:hypothetical protein